MDSLSSVQQVKLKLERADGLLAHSRKRRNPAYAIEDIGHGELLYSEAQDVLEDMLQKSQTASQRRGLEELANASNRGFTLSQALDAEISYNQCLKGYDASTQLLEESATMCLSRVIDNFKAAASSFKEYRTSFKTEEQKEMRKTWLRQVFELWADAYLKIGIDSYRRGRQLLTSAAEVTAEEGHDKQKMAAAVFKLENAATYLGYVRIVYRMAKSAGLELDESARAEVRQISLEMRAEAKRFGEVIKNVPVPQQGA